MRGPSSEEQQHYQHNVGQNQAIHNGYAYQQQVYAPQEGGNYNGNNRNAYYWPQGNQQYGAVAAHYNEPAHPEPSPTADESNPFAEYAWMGDAEEFDRQMMEQFEQEEYLESCFQEMWLEEENDGEWYIPPEASSAPAQRTAENLEKLTLSEPPAPTMLNPNAAEFVPRRPAVHH